MLWYAVWLSVGLCCVVSCCVEVNRVVLCYAVLGRTEKRVHCLKNVIDILTSV